MPKRRKSRKKCRCKTVQSNSCKRKTGKRKSCKRNNGKRKTLKRLRGGGYVKCWNREEKKANSH